MTSKQFLQSDEMEHIEAIWDGKLIATRKDGDWLYELYQIDKFFVEAKSSIEYKFYTSIAAIENGEEAMLLYRNLN